MAICTDKWLFIVTSEALICFQLYTASLKRICGDCSRGMLGWIVVILLVWTGICWAVTYIALTKLNFLKR